ncbi:hypothetical protein [Caproiciproducens sp. LBM24188]
MKSQNKPGRHHVDGRRLIVQIVALLIVLVIIGGTLLAALY